MTYMHSKYCLLEVCFSTQIITEEPAGVLHPAEKLPSGPSRRWTGSDGPVYLSGWAAVRVLLQAVEHVNTHFLLVWTHIHLHIPAPPLITQAEGVSPPSTTHTVAVTVT